MSTANPRPHPRRLFRLALATAVAVLAACQSSAGTAERHAPPQPGIAFRIASPEPCPTCENVPRREPGAPPLYLQWRPLLTSADISGIAKTIDPISGMPALEFRFHPEAHARVLAATSAHVGENAAWVMRGEVFYQARIAGPFSESMQLAGIDGDEQARIFGLLTGIKEERRIRDTPPAPAE